MALVGAPCQQRKEPKMNILKPEKKLAVISALIEGNSLRSTSRMTGVHKKTIMRMLKQVGNQCFRILDSTMKGLTCRVIECDEVWTFVRKKERKLTNEENIIGKDGDQYIFVGLDPDTKLVPAFVVGKRDALTTNIFLMELRNRIIGHPQLTTDGFKPYLEAVEQAFGSEVDYATLVKTYATENPGPGRYNPPKISPAPVSGLHYSQVAS
jgi:IS1 family transposase